MQHPRKEMLKQLDDIVITYELKLQIEEEKVSKCEDMSEVFAWSEEIDAQLKKVDEHIAQLVECINKAVQHADLTSKESDEKVLEVQ